MEKQKNIPKLRFPGFKEEWGFTSLGNISSNISYGMNSAAIQFDGVNKYIRITDIDEETREFTPNPLSSPDGTLEEKYKLKKGDLVFARTGASVGKTYLYKENDGNLYYAGFLIKFSLINSDEYFIYIQTLRSAYQKWIKLMSMRSGQPGVNAEEYKTYKFSIPTLPEQQKIAAFLTSVDERIAQLTKKKALLEQYKKGVMQKIFSQEIRFKDDNGKKFGVWEEKTLSYFLTIPEKQKPSVIDRNKLLTVKLHTKGVFKNDNTDSLSLGANYFIRKKGQFIYGKQNLFNGAFSLIPDEFDGWLSSTDVPSFNVDTNKVNPVFFLQYFSREFFYKKLEDIASGSGSKRIHENVLLQLRIDLPSIQEQTKIANFLSAIDKKIEGVDKQLEQTKRWKKGLLQQMFC